MGSSTFSSLLAMHEACHHHGKVYIALAGGSPVFVSQNWLYRLFYSLFLGYSFQLPQCTKELVVRAHNLLRTPVDQIPANELVSMLKIMGVASRLLSHAWQGKEGKRREELEHVSEQMEGIQKDLFLLAAHKGFAQTLEAFLTCGTIDPNTADEQGNTALHHALMSGQENAAALLLPHCNALAKNKNGRTPLLEAVYSSSKPAITLTHQNQVSPSRAFKRAVQEVIQHEVAFPYDCVEMAFLLDTPSITAALLKDMWRDDFERAIQFLKEKYPKTPIEHFYLAQFMPSKTHFATGYQFFNGPEDRPGNPSIQELFTLFDQLPWHQIDALSLLNEVRGRSLTYSQAAAKAELHHDLNLYIQRVHYRVFFAGMPAQPEQRERECRKIELALKAVIAELKAKENPKLVISVLKEIMKAANHCGPTYIDTAEELYLTICCHREVTPRFCLERHIAQQRMICLTRAVQKLYGQEFHAKTHAISDLGEELGIPGWQTAIFDPCAAEGYKKEDVRKKFFEEYTPLSIVLELLLPLLQSDASVRLRFIDLQKEVMPPSWHEERFSPIAKELASLPQHDEGKISALFTRHGIDRHPGKSAEEDLLFARYLDYLGNFVYDGSHFRLEALVYTLERIGVLTSPLPYRDRSRVLQNSILKIILLRS